MLQVAVQVLDQRGAEVPVLAAGVAFLVGALGDVELDLVEEVV